MCLPGRLPRVRVRKNANSQPAGFIGVHAPRRVASVSVIIYYLVRAGYRLLCLWPQKSPQEAHPEHSLGAIPPKGAHDPISDAIKPLCPITVIVCPTLHSSAHPNRTGFATLAYFAAEIPIGGMAQPWEQTNELCCSGMVKKRKSEFHVAGVSIFGGLDGKPDHSSLHISPKPRYPGFHDGCPNGNKIWGAKKRQVAL